MSGTNAPATPATPEEAEAVLSTPLFSSLVQTLTMQASWVSEKALMTFLREQALLPPEREGSGRVSQTTRWQNKVSKHLLAQYDIILTRQSETLWIRPKSAKKPSDYTYRPLYEDDLVRQIMNTYEGTFHRETTAREANATADTLQALVSDNQMVEFVDNEAIQITDSLFWDGGIGILRNIRAEMSGEETPVTPVWANNAPKSLGRLSTNGSRCFRKMFDTSFSSSQSIKWGDKDMAYWNSKKNESVIMDTYSKALKHLEASEGKLPIPMDKDDEDNENTQIYIHFIMEWADDSYDTYMDMLRGYASCFLPRDRKPKASYFLIGNTRNAKSTYNDLLRTMLGSNNCERIQLKDIGDWHAAPKLNNVIANLPDENARLPKNEKERDDALIAFKSTATHAQRNVFKMGAQTPIVLDCDFMSFFPMNHMPEWGKSGAEAESCVKRCWPIYFTRDFSQADYRVDNFAQTMFIPKVLARLVGVVLALASYHMTNELRPSPTMLSRQGDVEEATSSVSLYRKAFLEHFNGVESWKLLVRDYKLWCNDNEGTWAVRDDVIDGIKPLLKRAPNGHSRSNITVDGQGRISCYLFKNWTKDTSNVMHSGTLVPGMISTKTQGPATIEDLHGTWYGDEKNPPANGHSILTVLAEIEKEEEAQQQYLVTPDPNQISPKKPKSSPQILKEKGL